MAFGRTGEWRLAGDDKWRSLAPRVARGAGVKWRSRTARPCYRAATKMACRAVAVNGIASCSTPAARCDRRIVAPTMAWS